MLTNRLDIRTIDADLPILILPNMVSYYPSLDAAPSAMFSPMSSRSAAFNKATPYQARPELYGAFSVVDDAKDKAKELSAEAQKEFNKAASQAKASTSKMELYSPSYYAACTFGGLLACVSPRLLTEAYTV